LGMAGGALLIIGGGFMMVRQTQAYQETAGAAKSTAGTLAWLAGPEAGAAEEGGMAAGTSSRQSMRMGPYTSSRTQRGPSPGRQMTPADQINAEANRYRAYSQAMAEYRKAGGRIP
jgi:hypothetical protein